MGSSGAQCPVGAAFPAPSHDGVAAAGLRYSGGYRPLCSAGPSHICRAGFGLGAGFEEAHGESLKGLNILTPKNGQEWGMCPAPHTLEPAILGSLDPQRLRGSLQNSSESAPELSSDS